MNRQLFVPVLAVLVSACEQPVDVPVVAERYVTPSDPAMNIDSVATHGLGGGGAWLFATAKEGHVIRIYDAASGEHLRDLGAPGAGPGELRRPNGILAADGMLIVVERDNARVQIFSASGLEPVTSFGEDVLERPYGAWLEHRAPGSYRLYVTDAYETADGRVPPPAALDRRVHVFSLGVERGTAGEAAAVTAVHERAFGETEGPGMLYGVESIWGDPANDRLLVAEEDETGGRVIKVYGFDGRYAGAAIGDGIFRTEPEGIALYECADGTGYWITTDQDDGRNVFHLFDRQTLAHLGGFAGELTRNTDGIWLAQEVLPGFPAGALFAVHDDRAVAAFDWRDITAALALPPGCPVADALVAP